MTDMVHEIDNYALTVLIDDQGGEVKSLKDRSGREYIWQGHPDSWGGYSPVLFPICGSLRSNQALLENGKTVTLNRHGFARKKLFTCEFAGDGKAQFYLSSNEETLVGYPYPFLLTIQYELSGSTLKTTYQVKNTGSEAMPFFIGGHPGFNCPIQEGALFTDYVIEFEHEESLDIAKAVTATGLLNVQSRRELLSKSKVLQLSYELFEQDALTLDSLLSRRVRLRHKEQNHGVELDFCDYPYLILWSDKRKDFVAMEPWSGLSTCSDEGDQFEAKRNVMILSPGESRNYCYKITVF